MPPWFIYTGGDFNNDGTTDLLFRNNDFGTVGIQLIENVAVAGWSTINTIHETEDSYWYLNCAGDFNGDGTDDILLTQCDYSQGGLMAVGVWKIENANYNGWQTIA